MALKKPEITVDAYRPIAKPGGVFEFHDRENPDLDLRVRIRNDGGNIFAEISHRGGRGATGMPRPANGGDLPPPPPPPPSRPGDVELPTYDAFLSQEGPEVDRAYGRPSLADAGHTAWRRLNENWSHENILRDVRQQPPVDLHQRQRRRQPSYDAWLNEEIPAIADAIRSTHHRDASTADIRHNAWRRFVEGWTVANLIHDIKGEPLEEPPRPARTGLVRVENHTFVDDGGPFLALGATFFWLAWGYRHDRDRLRENLTYLAARGVDYVRALGVVGPSSWSDRTIDPNWSDYRDVIAGATDLAHDAFGLRVQWTVFGGVDTTPSRSDRERVIDRFIEMSHGREQKIMAFEIANEGYQTGFGGSEGAAEAKALCRRLKAGVPHAVAVTAPEPDHESASMYYDGAGADFATYHLSRNTTDLGGMWRPARQAWDPQFFDGNPRAWTSNEPIGPQSSVAEDADPLRLTMSAVLVWLCGGAGYVLHCGAGVRGGGVEDLQRGRSSNFWETPDIDAILTGLRASRAALPPDLPNWTRVNVSPHASNFANYPFELQPLLDAQDQSPRRLLRAFCALGGSRFVIAPIQIQGDVHFVAKQHTEVELVHPLTREIYRRETLNGAGDRLTVRPGQDPEALILLGRR